MLDLQCGCNGSYSFLCVQVFLCFLWFSMILVRRRSIYVSFVCSPMDISLSPMLNGLDYCRRPTEAMNRLQHVSNSEMTKA